MFAVGQMYPCRRPGIYGLKVRGKSNEAVSMSRNECCTSLEENRGEVRGGVISGFLLGMT